MRDTTVGIVLLALSVITLAGTVTFIDTRQNQVLDSLQSDAVYATCQNTRMGLQSEADCAQLQDKYGIVYQCRDRNTSPNNNCWTEAL